MGKVRGNIPRYTTEEEAILMEQLLEKGNHDHLFGNIRIHWGAVERVARELKRSPNGVLRKINRMGKILGVKLHIEGMIGGLAQSTSKKTEELVLPHKSSATLQKIEAILEKTVGPLVRENSELKRENSELKKMLQELRDVREAVEKFQKNFLKT